MTALATSLSATGDVDAAAKLGRATLEGLRELLGYDHPHALACANNLALDLQILGQSHEADELRADTLKRYDGLLPSGHLDRADADERKRVALDFEPPPL